MYAVLLAKDECKSINLDLPCHSLEKPWKDLCRLTGRYCEPFLSGPKK